MSGSGDDSYFAELENREREREDQRQSVDIYENTSKSFEKHASYKEEAPIKKQFDYFYGEAATKNEPYRDIKNTSADEGAQKRNKFLSGMTSR